MLKDIFLKLKQDAGDIKGVCIVGKVYKTMDEETREAFVGVCRSAAFTTEITKVLRADGHNISRETFSRRRSCFMNQNPDCCLKEECPK
jgi:hypothetical protein